MPFKCQWKFRKSFSLFAHSQSWVISLITCLNRNNIKINQHDGISLPKDNILSIVCVLKNRYDEGQSKKVQECRCITIREPGFNIWRNLIAADKFKKYCAYPLIALSKCLSQKTMWSLASLPLFLFFFFLSHKIWKSKHYLKTWLFLFIF